MFAHVPGLKVVAPSTPYDAKGLLISSIMDENPVVFIDDRWLYRSQEEVPEEIYQVPIGKGIIRNEGKAVTLVSFSYMAVEAQKAVDELKIRGIDVEFIDLRTVKPLDQDMIFNSVKKTGKLVIADGSWKTGSVAGEISALVSENIF
jgi:pyruvate dehydrogenase E1 component beta subunit